MSGVEVLEALTGAERRVVARTLNALESGEPQDHLTSEDAGLRELVDGAALHQRPGGLVVGLTGPPGVGKSTLAGKLVAAWRSAGHSVGVIAVDPSSRASGGALLGDRARMGLDGRDPKVFVRSMAARDRLGGLAPATELAVYVMRAAWDRVLIETVGVGQSETDVAEVADVTVVVVQPGSGDTLQFLKSGLMDVPDVLVVNKADLGGIAKRAATDLRAALVAVQRRHTPVLATSATGGAGGEGARGIDALVRAIDAVQGSNGTRHDRIKAHAVRMLAAEVGRRGIRRLGGLDAVHRRARDLDGGPLALLAALGGAG